MIERPQGGERAILVQLALPGIDTSRALAEFEELALSAQAEVLAKVEGARSRPEAKYYVGLGKAQEILEQVIAHQAELVLVNHELTPSQERNLERLLSCRVVGRSGLILDIFAQRARTFEGKLQVELAQLEHLSTRLIRGWTHLERQKGGIGLRGPGETQLETDRRLLKDRIKYITKRLDKVRRTRDENRRARQKNGMHTVSLVGYTNAGKSTLFNRLTGENNYVANQLFATLDPSMSKMHLPGASSVVLTDTVGFIRDLPHQLIDAFRATLEETQQASLLLHVMDASDDLLNENSAAVNQVLHDLGVTDIPVINVFNKIDQLSDRELTQQPSDGLCQVWVSAHTGEGIDLLMETIATQLHGLVVEDTLFIAAKDARLRAQLYQLNAVIADTVEPEGGWFMRIKLTQEQKQRLFPKPVDSDDV